MDLDGQAKQSIELDYSSYCDCFNIDKVNFQNNSVGKKKKVRSHYVNRTCKVVVLSIRLECVHTNTMGYLGKKMV